MERAPVGWYLYSSCDKFCCIIMQITDLLRRVDKLEFISLYENVSCGNSSSNRSTGLFFIPVELSGLLVKAVLIL